MKIGFLGFGNMAQAMAGGLVRSGAVQPGDIGACARDRAKLRSNTEPQGFRLSTTRRRSRSSPIWSSSP